jgi:hypothetical protein
MRWAGLLLVCSALLSWHLVFGMQLISNLDAGVLIHVAWLEYHGAIAYHDFSSGFPPLFLVPAGWAFSLWGPSWFSLVLLIGLFSSGTFVWSYFILLKAGVLSSEALGYSLALQIIVLMPTSFWWYNEISWMVCSLFIASTLGVLSKNSDKTFSTISFIISGALVGLSKANMGPPLIFLILLVVLLNKRYVFVVTSVTGMCTLALLFLDASRIGVLDLIHNYQSVSGRVNFTTALYFIQRPYEFENEIQIKLLVLLVFATFSLIRFVGSESISKRNLLVCLMLVGVVSFFAIMTNFQRKAVASACLIVILPFITKPSILKAPYSFFCWAMSITILFAYCVLALMVGYDRSWLLYYGCCSYDPPGWRVRIDDPPFFRGMILSRFDAQVVSNLSMVVRDLHLHQDLDKKVFFGPDVDFAYAAFDLRSPRGLPLFWETIPSGQQSLDPRVQRFLQTKFDVCVFLKYQGINQMAFIPVEIQKDVIEKYDVHSYPLLSVYIRKAHQ